jgi:hypothetical protein
MKSLVIRNLNGKLILFLFIVTNAIYAVMVIVTIPKVTAFSNGMKILDMMPTGYNADYVYSLFNILGEEGRHAYLCRQLPVDMFYPLFSGVTYCLMLAYFLKKLGKSGSNLFYLCFLPLIAALFDYGENLGIITLLKLYPYKLMGLVQVTNVFSVLKSFTTAITFIILIALLIVFAYRKIFMKLKLTKK